MTARVGKSASADASISDHSFYKIIYLFAFGHTEWHVGSNSLAGIESAPLY